MVAFRPLELPGRGRRHHEPLRTSFDSLTGDLLAQMLPLAQKAPYALFGHSMGALLALLCAIQAPQSGMPRPRALFLSAAAAPIDWEECRPASMASLPSRQLWDQVAGMGGLPDCVAASTELLAYLEPILRADFAAFESWHPAPMAPLPVPITVFLGDHDSVTEQQGRKWRRLTTNTFRMHTFPGNHFYLQDHWRDLAACISRTLHPAV